MRILFFVWGGFGMFMTLFILFNPPTQNFSFVNSLMLMWIGGMVFFGLGSMLWHYEIEKTKSEIEKPYYDPKQAL